MTPINAYIMVKKANETYDKLIDGQYDRHYTRASPYENKAKTNKHRTCYNCRNKGHEAKDCPNKFEEVHDEHHALVLKPGEYAKKPRTSNCYICIDNRHIAKDCPNKLRENEPTDRCTICGAKEHTRVTCLFRNSI